MKCRKKDCNTIISKVANLGVYCFIHQREIAKRDTRIFLEEEDKKRWKKGVQITKYVTRKSDLTPFRANLKGKKTKILTNKAGEFALFRFS